MSEPDAVPHPLLPMEPPFSPEVATLLSNYPHRDGYLLSLFRVFANSGRFLKKGVLNLLDRESPLSVRQREIVILRVCARNACEYEWGVHVAAFARYAGLTEAQVAATSLERRASGNWPEDERVLITAVDELCDTGRMTADTRRTFQTRFTAEQQLEILALCGNYHTVSFVANTAGLAGESFAARFPSR